MSEDKHGSGGFYRDNGDGTSTWIWTEDRADVENPKPVGAAFDLTPEGIAAEIEGVKRNAPDSKARQAKYIAKFKASGRTVLADWDPYMTKLAELEDPFGELDNGLPKVDGTIELPGIE